MTEHTVFPMQFPSTFGDGKPVTTSTDGVQTVINVLSDATQFGYWSLDAPEVYHNQEVAQKSKENNPDPAMYVWSPVDGSLEQFSADNDDLNTDRTVEIQIWTLETDSTGSDCQTYHEEVIDFLQEYADDNYQNTEFHYIQPESVTDSRSDHIARMTDHSIMSVQVEVHNLRE